MKWKTLSSTYISNHQYFTARQDKCEMPDGRIVEEYFVVELPESACALAITNDHQAVMVKQYRYPTDETLLELPGGFIDKGEDPLTAIRRELKEETGYEFKNIYRVGKVAANPGLLNNYTHLFLATGGEKVTSQQLDHNEEIEIVMMPINEVRRKLELNEFSQSLHVCCMLYAFQKLDES